MKRILIILLLGVVSFPAFAQMGSPIIIPIWPDGAPNDNGIVTEEGHPSPRSVDDQIVPFDDSIKYFKELQARKIPSVLHIYPTGGHGWCEGPWFHYSREWKTELERWLVEW